MEGDTRSAEALELVEGPPEFRWAVLRRPGELLMSEKPGRWRPVYCCGFFLILFFAPLVTGAAFISQAPGAIFYALVAPILLFLFLGKLYNMLKLSVLEICHRGVRYRTLLMSRSWTEINHKIDAGWHSISITPQIIGDSRGGYDVGGTKSFGIVFNEQGNPYFGTSNSLDELDWLVGIIQGTVEELGVLR